MKAVVLCAGRGTRMLPLTKKTHKVLIEVRKRPFLYYVLRNLQKAGFDDIALVVGYMREAFEPFLQKYGFAARLVVQDEQLGTAHAVLQAEGFTGKGCFAVVGGDTLLSPVDYSQAKSRDEFCYVTGTGHSHPEKYGVIVEENGFLVSMPEKPLERVGNIINVGLYKFTPEIYNAIRHIKKSPRGEYEINDAIMHLAKDRRVRVLMLKGKWRDFGCLRDISVMESHLGEVYEEAD